MKNHRFLAILAGFCLTSLAARGQSPVVMLVAGKPGEGLTLAEPFAVAFDASGRPLVAEYQGHRVSRINVDGRLVPVAGTGKKGFSGDGGPAVSADFRDIHNIVTTSEGDLYIADTGNHRVRRVDPHSGVVTTVAGTGQNGFSGDGGLATRATFGGIYSIAFDAEGRRMYLADLDNRRVRVVDLASGIVTTAAGNGKKGVPADGDEAIQSPLTDPRAVAVDRKGNLYILERGGHALRVVDPAGKIRTVAGTGKAGSSGDDGPARLATLNGPKHLWVDREDRVLMADTENHRIRRFHPEDGKIVAVAGSGVKGSAGVGGPAGGVELNRPHGVAVDRAGVLYIADSDNHRVLKLGGGR